MSKRVVSSLMGSGARLTRVALGALLAAGTVTAAFAQGGQTEVHKTYPVPSAAPAPAAPPANQVDTLPVEPSTPAAKPTSPIGGTASTSAPGWQTDLAQQPPVTPEPAAAPIQESDLEVVAKINDYFNKMTFLQGVFVQSDPDTKQKRGKFYLARGGKVRFDYGAPSRLKIIADGKYLAIEDHDLNTSDRYPLEVTPFRLLLSEHVDLINDANILGVEQWTDVVVLTVEDKKGDGSGRIRLMFSKPDMVLKEWIITDAQGLSTKIEVANLEENKAPAPDVFEFSKTIGFKAAN
ncbi:outer membrane lipoprotein carrier protein LolA [Rhodomicrobium vannielii ATCC 17100]|uniref:Outer membrane lipoprotein carrier protein LolA n=1 Tax=Rhodomicrobium vannielii (strain ATCC 17100 / DSM 162 / LMG 4299 / NCIMB 10020 / ATH 3.1.1) TaxID=648757 RepID=E3I390_RHOVT|nr:outer-membrane lipoprotein carrier protein LolA [Rhodomicrobium vannielii]ADP71451.1 outer membrane lipoprotein carrier protein LolA [Rhodomicrobium vannielii ATCC 17100]